MQRSTTRTKCWAVTSFRRPRRNRHHPSAQATGQERHHIHQKGTAEARHEFNGVFVAVIAAEKTADGWAVPDYRVCTTYEGGKSVMEDDPYRLPASIGDWMPTCRGRPPRTLWEP